MKINCDYFHKIHINLLGNSLKSASRWKWGGCSHNMNFAIEFSELFLDSQEKAGDIQSKINLHNNHVGRMVKVYIFNSKKPKNRKI